MKNKKKKNLNTLSVFGMSMFVLIGLLGTACSKKNNSSNSTSTENSQKPGSESPSFNTSTSVGNTSTSSDDDCVDGECEVPEYDENGQQVYAIVSPVGYNVVDMIEQAPRLDTLNGKKIALVGGSFMATTTHFELKRLIEKNYPSATVYMFNEVGSGGPFSVYGQSAQTKNFQNKLKSLGIDAVISGNCGCGLCTTKESGSAIAAEYIGIPSVTVGAPTFIAQIHSTGVNRGVPVLRAAEYPGAFASHSEAELIDNTRNIVWPQVVDLLTSPITQAEIDLYANDGERPYDEIIYYGNLEEVQEFYQVNGWTDGLPVIPATDAKIKEYLQFTPYEAGDIIGKQETMPVAYRKCFAYTVAANAVMSGVPKEFMPLCIAIVKLMDNGEWRRTLSSTHGWTPYAWLNGPVARQLGIDCGQGMISEENNKALGRFIDLAMLNIGGYYIKENRMGTFGYLTPWTFAEDDAACVSIGWKPYHVTQGYSLNSSTVTVGSALAWGNNVTPSTDDPEQIMKVMAFDITEKQQNGLGNTHPQVYRTVFITEPVAKNLSKLYVSKGALEDALIENARRPLIERAYALYWANTGSQQDKKYTFEEFVEKLKTEGYYDDYDEDARETPVPDWLKGIVDEDTMWTIATMLKGQTPLLVTGDSDRNKFQVMPGGGYATVEIELPDNWDELLAPLGYEPLSHFYLEEVEFSEPTPKPDTDTTKDIAAHSALSDGTYRLVASTQQVKAGTIYRSNNQLTFGDDKTTISLENGSSFTKVMSALGTGCSITIKGGIVTEIYIRPLNTANGKTTDVSSLQKQDFGTAKVTFAINTKQSSAGGNATTNDTSVIISSTIDELYFDLGGTVVVGEDNTSNFIQYSNGKLTINSEAATGSVCTFRALNDDNQTYRTVTFTKKGNAIEIKYNDGKTA